MQILAASRITQTQQKLLHLELCRPCRIAEPFDAGSSFVKCPFNKIKILWWATIALEKSRRLIYININLNSCETVPLIQTKLNICLILIIFLRLLHSRSRVKKWVKIIIVSLSCANIIKILTFATLFYLNFFQPQYLKTKLKLAGEKQRTVQNVSVIWASLRKSVPTHIQKVRSVFMS